MDVHNSAEWKRLCAQEDRMRLIGELKQEQVEVDADRRADTASLEKGLTKVVGDGKVVGWVNSKRASETFRPRTRFPSPPPLPFAQNVQVTNAQGKVIKMTRVIHVPRYGPTRNSMYGTTYHQKAIPEHWQRPQEEEFPGTVVKASAGHYLKDDGFWDFGQGRPSRIGRPLWHSFAPRPEAITVSTPYVAAPRSGAPSRCATTSRGSRQVQVNDKALEVERKATALMHEAKAEVDDLKWVRSLGFMRTGEAEGPEHFVRPETRTLHRLIPQDQRGPTAVSQVAGGSVTAISAIPPANLQPISAGPSRGSLMEGARIVQTPHYQNVEQIKQPNSFEMSTVLPTLSTSPRSPSHKPAFPATFRSLPDPGYGPCMACTI